MPWKQDRACGVDRPTWTAPLLARYLTEQTAIEVSERTVRRGLSEPRLCLPPHHMGAATSGRSGAGLPPKREGVEAVMSAAAEAPPVVPSVPASARAPTRQARDRGPSRQSAVAWLREMLAFWPSGPIRPGRGRPGAPANAGPHLDAPRPPTQSPRPGHEPEVLCQRYRGSCGGLALVVHPSEAVCRAVRHHARRLRRALLGARAPGCHVGGQCSQPPGGQDRYHAPLAGCDGRQGRAGVPTEVFAGVAANRAIVAAVATQRDPQPHARRPGGVGNRQRPLAGTGRCRSRKRAADAEHTRELLDHQHGHRQCRTI